MSSSSRGKDYDHIFKLLLIGDDRVGKSQLNSRYTDENFSEYYLPTVGVDYRQKSQKIAGKVIKQQIWDTAGQERFRTITSAYYRGADAIILVFDLTDLRSFENIKKQHLTSLEKYARNDVRIVLIGNKSDLTDKIVVDQAAINELVADKKNKILAYFPVSACQGIGVDAAFRAATESIMKQKGLMPSAPQAIAESRSLPNDSKNIELSSLLPNNNSSSDSPTPKEVLVARLEKYIKRVSSYDRDDHGFWFFKRSRADNRRANFYLAASLFAALKKTDGSIDDIRKIFGDIDNQRASIIDNLDLETKGRGINSSELNQVIERANYFIKRSF